MIPAGAKSTAGWPLLKCCLVVDVFVPYHHLFSEFLFLSYHILTKYFMYLHCPPEGLVGPDNCSAPEVLPKSPPSVKTEGASIPSSRGQQGGSGVRKVLDRILPNFIFLG